MKKTKMKKSTMPILSFFILALSFVGMTFAGTKINEVNANDGVTYLSERVVTSTTAGTVLKGDKVVIVNTNLDSSKKQSVGTFDFVSKLNDATNSSQSISEPKAMNTIKNSNSSPKASTQSITTYAVNDTAILRDYVSATCIAVGEHCYVFAETSELNHSHYEKNGGPYAFGQGYANEYDTFTYPYILKASGVTSDSDIPYRGTDKMCILLDLETDRPQAGFYVGKSMPSVVILCGEDYPNSQRDLLVHEVNHFLDDVFGQGGAGDLTEGLATTLQMHARRDISNVDPWIITLSANTYLRMGMPAFTISRDYGTDINYSYNYLFFRYLITQKLGSFWHEDVPEFFALLHSESYAGRMPDDLIDAMEYMVNNYDANEDSDSLSDTITSFFVATVAHEETGKYGFYGDPQMKRTFPSYPSYYANSNPQIPGRSCIVVETVNGEFTIPSDCGNDIRFFAITVEQENPAPLGSITNPILIYFKEDLNQLDMSKSKGKYFKLANDIDLGNEEYVLDWGIKGHIDGDGHTIKGKLYVGDFSRDITISNLIFDINRVQFTSSNNNIFNALTNANIENVHIINSHPDFPVALTKSVERSNISRCSVIQDANITSSTHSSFGYIVSGEGSPGGSTIENCLVAGNLNLASGTYNNVGGFIPKTDTGFGDFTIKNSVSAINLTSNSSQGNIGLVMADSNPSVGYRYKITFEDVYYLIGANPVATGSFDGCIGVSSLTTQSEFSKLNFDFMWKIGEFCPILQTNEEMTTGATITNASIPESTHLGAEPNLASATITLSRDGSSFDIPMKVTMLNLDDYWNITSAGAKTLNGTYFGIPFEATINVVEMPDDIVFLNPPVATIDSNKIWLADTIFNGVGNFQVQYYHNGKTYSMLSNFTTSLDGQMLTVGTKNITFYVGNKSFEYSIDVKRNGIKSMTVITTNSVYYSIPNEPLILDNLAIEIIRENGDSFICGPESFSDYGIEIFINNKYDSGKVYYTYGTNLYFPTRYDDGDGYDRNIGIVIKSEEDRLAIDVGNLEYGYAVEMDIANDEDDYFPTFIQAFRSERYESWEHIVETGYQFYNSVNFFGDPGTDYTKPFAYSPYYGDDGLYYYSGFSGWTINYDDITKTFHLSTSVQKNYCPFTIKDINFDSSSPAYLKIYAQLPDVDSLSIGNEQFETADDALIFIKDILINAVYSYYDSNIQKIVTIKDIVISKTGPNYYSTTTKLNSVSFKVTFNDPCLDVYTLQYEWTNAPDLAILPTDNNTYQMYSNRAQNFDTTFTKDYQIMYKGDTYTFTGWEEKISSVSSEGIVVTLVGDWTKIVHQHNYISEITIAPTCSDTGVKTHTCSICEDSYTEELSIDINKHAYGDLIPEVPATETTEGTKEHKTCLDCGKHFDKDGNELTSLIIEKKPSSSSANPTLVAGLTITSLTTVGTVVGFLFKFGKIRIPFKK